jgi:hypothetical protein
MQPQVHRFTDAVASALTDNQWDSKIQEMESQK